MSDRTRIRFKLPGAKAGLYGKRGLLNKRFKEAELLAKNLGAEEFHAVIPPISPNAPGWHTIISEPCAPFYQAEGIVLTAGKSAGTLVRDCQALIVHYEDRWGLSHIGRGSYKKPPFCCGFPSTTHALLHKLHVLDGSKASATIVQSIAPQHFPHDHIDFVEHFIQEYGADVVPDMERHTLDLNLVTVRCLEKWGIKNVKIVGEDPFESSRLSSRRAENAGQPDNEHPNWVILSVLE